MSSSYFASDRRPAGNDIKSPTLSSGPISSALTPSSSKVNALQSRIATVLSASYADLEISETLKTLDSRGIKNDAETRRNLRLDLQQELISRNGEVVKDFSHVAEQLKRVGLALQHLNNTCSSIRAHVTAARKETGPMLEEHGALTEQRRQTVTKQRLLQAFNARFILSDDDTKALTSSALSIDRRFYDVLSRTKEIHDDCQVLLGFEKQTLGLEILDQTTRNLDAAYQKLFRWTLKELKNVDLENPQLDNAIREAFRVLAERPTLFQNCLDFFAESREEILSDAFYAALTGTGPNSSTTVAVPSTAIELNAHEPMRYIGDMLAWVHAAAVGEREALQNLFISDAEEISRSLRLGRKNQPWLQDKQTIGPSGDSGEETPVFDGKQALAELIDRDIHGVVRQLRERTEQMIGSHEDAVLAYQVSNLISFYRAVFQPLLGRGSNLDANLGPAGDMAMEQFRIITQDHIKDLHGEADEAPDDLSPPEFLEEALEALRKLMRSYDASFATPISTEERNRGFEPVLVEALDPYLAGCESIAQRMPVKPDCDVFALNCLLYTRAAIRGPSPSSLPPPSYTFSRLQAIDEQIALHRANLTDCVHQWLVAESGLGQLFAAVQPYVTTDLSASRCGNVRALDAMQMGALEEAAGRLDAFLPTCMEDARAICVGRLRDRALARGVCEEAADRFVERFEGLERVLVALDEVVLAGIEARHGPGLGDGEDGQGQDRNGDGYGDGGEVVYYLRDAFPRTSDEIKVLLS